MRLAHPLKIASRATVVDQWKTKNEIALQPRAQDLDFFEDIFFQPRVESDFAEGMTPKQRNVFPSDEKGENFLDSKKSAIAEQNHFFHFEIHLLVQIVALAGKGVIRELADLDFQDLCKLLFLRL